MNEEYVVSVSDGDHSIDTELMPLPEAVNTAEMILKAYTGFSVTLMRIRNRPSRSITSRYQADWQGLTNTPRRTVPISTRQPSRSTTTRNG